MTSRPALRRPLRLVALLAVALLTPGCAAAVRVDSPLSFRADRRLHIVAPSDGSEVDVPLTLRWRADGFPRRAGDHFAVYLDRAPVGPGKALRWRYCTARERQPVVPGEDRGQCHDDRLQVFSAAAPSLTLSCLTPRDGAPRRVRDHHTVTVILLDANDRRVGHAAARTSFTARGRIPPCPLPSD